MIAAGFDRLAPHDRDALDYWFWKFHVDDLAFLVDVIIRRREARAETRVSLWIGDVPRIVHAFAAEWTATDDLVRTAHAELSATSSSGQVEDIRWNLAWQQGASVISPLPRLIAATPSFDMSMRVWPAATFSGSVTIGDRTWSVDNEPGLWMHYWGRRLAPAWLWASASRFDDRGRRVEVEIARTSLFGSPLEVPLGYVWLSDGDHEETIVSPLNGLIRLRRVEDSWVVRTASARGRRHTIVIRAGSVAPNDLGDGITQTLRGDLVVDGISAEAGTVGVETRRWSL